MGYKVVVVGATGNVGREMLSILSERQFPVDEIAALASRRSLGTEVSFGDQTIITKDLETFNFEGWDIALFAIGSDATKKFAPKAAAKDCIVIDNSSLYRYDPNVIPGDCFSIYLRYDQWNVRIVPVKRAVIYDNTSFRCSYWSIFFCRIRTYSKKGNVLPIDDCSRQKFFT